MDHTVTLDEGKRRFDELRKELAPLLLRADPQYLNTYISYALLGIYVDDKHLHLVTRVGEQFAMLLGLTPEEFAKDLETTLDTMDRLAREGMAGLRAQQGTRQ